MTVYTGITLPSGTTGTERELLTGMSPPVPKIGQVWPRGSKSSAG